MPYDATMARARLARGRREGGMEVHGEVRDDDDGRARGGRALAHRAEEARVALGLLRGEAARRVLEEHEHPHAGLVGQGLGTTARHRGIVEAGPGQIQRIRHVGEVGKQLLDTVGAGDDGGQLESGSLRDVQGEGDLATGRTQHADAARLRPRGEAGTEGGHLDQLVEGADAHHARRAPALRAPALHHDDGLAESGGSSRGGHEALRLPELLEEADDHAHVVVVDEVVDVLGRGGCRLVARRDEVAEADVAAGIQEGDADGAALHHRGHAAPRGVVGDGGAPGGGAAREVDEAETVRPTHGQVVCPCNGGELGLGAHSVGSRLAETAREDRCAARAALRRCAHGFHYRGLGHRDEDEVDGLADGVEGRISPPAEELGPARRDEVHGAWIVEALQGEPRVEPGPHLLGGADDGDGGWAQQPGHAHGSTSLAAHAALMGRSEMEAESGEPRIARRFRLVPPLQEDLETVGRRSDEPGQELVERGGIGVLDDVELHSFSTPSRAGCVKPSRG